MKFTKTVHRQLPAIGRNKGHEDYIGKGILTKVTRMGTGYRGRGLQNLYWDAPEGTEIEFTLNEYNDYESKKPYTYLIIKADHDHERYEASWKNDDTLAGTAKKLKLETVGK